MNFYIKHPKLFIIRRKLRHWYYCIKKLLWCQWFHRRFKCYPSGCFIDGDPNYWHCDKCLGCGKHDGFDLLFPEKKKPYPHDIGRLSEYKIEQILNSKKPWWLLAWQFNVSWKCIRDIKNDTRNK